MGLLSFGVRQSRGMAGKILEDDILHYVGSLDPTIQARMNRLMLAERFVEDCVIRTYVIYDWLGAAKHYLQAGDAEEALGCYSQAETKLEALIDIIRKNHAWIEKLKLQEEAPPTTEKFDEEP